MKQLLSGTFFSNNQKQQRFNGLILTDSEYHLQKPIPWHYHENAYFSYVVKGHLVEVNKKESIICSPGTLVFNNTHDPHFNKDHSKYTRQFYIEINHTWFKNHHVETGLFRDSVIHNNPYLISLARKIHQEFKINDGASQISIEGLLLLGFGSMSRSMLNETSLQPAWVLRIKEIIHEKTDEKITLRLLSGETGIHPIYLSQNFNRYFQTSLGGYVRKVRVGKSVALLSDKKLSIGQIAYRCGFSDQSHYIRCFKEINHITPAQYRKVLFAS